MKNTQRVLALLLVLFLMFGNVTPAMATGLTEEPVVVTEEAPVVETEAPVVETEEEIVDEATDEVAESETSEVIVGVVTATELNVRDEPSSNGNRVDTLKRGTVVEIYETVTVDGYPYPWGRISTGWILMAYVAIDGEVTEPEATEPEATEPENPEVIVGVVNLPTDAKLLVHEEPSTNGNPVYQLNGGTVVEIFEVVTVEGRSWGRISTGWIQMAYVTIDGDATEPENPAVIAVGILTSTLNVRDEPGTDGNLVARLAENTVVEIFEVVTVGGFPWGRTSFGWINMDYVDIDGDTTEPEVTEPTPDAPASALQEGVAYNIKAANGTGTLWFNGTITSGRFNGTYTESEAVSVYAENVTGGFLLYILDGETKQYICMADKSAGGSFGTDAATATVFEWNAEKATAAVADDANNRAFGCQATSTYANFSAYDLSNADYNWGQFVVAEGGTTEPEVTEPEVTEPEVTEPTPDAPASALQEGVAYNIKAENGNGTLWFNGTITSGRFNGTYTESEAVSVYAENVTGGFLLYILEGEAKQYICIEDKSAGGSFGTDAATATVFEWNAEKATAAVAEDSNNRGFGCGATSTYANFSAYDLTGSYNWGQYVVAEGGTTEPDPEPTEPEVTEPEVTEPEVTEPEVTEPEVTEPTPDAPASALQEGVAYNIKAENGNGTLWFNGTITSGRFNGTYTESEAVSVYAENVTGGFLLYILEGEAKQYICIEDKSAGGSFGTDAAAATVFEWNAEKATAAVAEDSNNRGFGCGATSTYANFSAYDLTGSYNWGQFVAVDNGTTEPTEPELGSEQNPIDVAFEMNETYTVATATVTVPANTTYYFQAFGIGGMELSINGGEPTLMSGNPRMPVVFTVTNDTDAEAEFTLTASYPAGSQMNPAALVMGENVAAIAAGSQGYYYTWIAEGTGTLTVEVSAQPGWFYVINNLTTYQYGDSQWNDSDPVVNPAVINVNAGDEIQLIVNTYTPNSWEVPAGNVTVNASFEYPLGSVENPEQVTFEPNGDNTAVIAQVAVPANATYYITFTTGMMGGDMELYIDNEHIDIVNGSVYEPVNYELVNDSETMRTYVLALVYPYGSWMNPANLNVSPAADAEYFELNNEAQIRANSTGYVYTWYADMAGELTIELCNTRWGWSYVVNNLTAGQYGNQHYSYDIPAQNAETIVVNAGDEIQLIVNTCGKNAEEPETPEGAVGFKATFAEYIGIESNPYYIDEDLVWNYDGPSPVASIDITVPANTNYVIYSQTLSNKMLSINGGEAVLMEDLNYAGVTHILENTEDTEKVFSLVITYPAEPEGTWGNPAELVIGENSCEIEENSMSGYLYGWTATAAGELTITMGENVPSWSYQVNNLTQGLWGDQLSSIDGAEGTYTISVNAGDEIQININTALNYETWSTPAGTVTFTADFAYAVGAHESNPDMNVFEWNEEHTEAWGWVEVPAHSTYYIGAVTSPMSWMPPQMELYVNGELKGLYGGNNFNPGIIELVNDNDWGEGYDLYLQFPYGSMERPAWIQDGKNTANVPAGGQYIYEREVWGPAYVTITVNSESNWAYTLNRTVYTWDEQGNEVANDIYGDIQTATDGQKTLTFFVENREKLQLIVSTEDWQEGEVSFKFTEATKAFSIAVGKSKTLKFTNPSDGKTIDAKKVTWKIEGVFNALTGKKLKTSSYASIKNGKLTSKDKKITDPLIVLIQGTYKKQTNDFFVYIHPKATSMQIDAYGWDHMTGEEISADNVNGETITWVINRGDLWLQADAQGEWALDEASWKSSNTKILKVDKYGNLMPVVKNGKVATGTVTITATAKDGSGKKASVKVSTSWLADGVDVHPKNNQWTMGSGTSLQMIADVDPNASDKSVAWSASAGEWVWNWDTYEDEWVEYEGIVTIDENGVLTAAEGLDRSYQVEVIATTKDGGEASNNAWVTIIPAAAEVKINAPETYDLRNGNYAWFGADVFTADGNYAECGTKWTSSNTKIAKVTEWGEVTFTGKLGKVTLTATAIDGSGVKDSVTIKVVKAPNAVRVSASSTYLAAGESLSLKATVGAEIYNPETDTFSFTTKGLSDDEYKWKAEVVELQYNEEEGYYDWVAVDNSIGAKVSKNKLTVSTKKFNKVYDGKNPIYVMVTATAEMPYTETQWVYDEELGYEVEQTVEKYASGSWLVMVSPATTKVYIKQHGTTVNGKTIKLDTDAVAVLYAEPKPQDAGMGFTWKSSNTKIAKIEYNVDGSVSVVPTGKKTGTVTITAKAADGSGKSATMKVKVIRKVDSISVDTAKFALSGKSKGNSFDLNKLVTLNPENATYDELTWTIAPVSKEIAKENKITLSKEGKLTAKKNVAEPVTIRVVASAKDGYGAVASFPVTITPAATKITIVNNDGIAMGSKETVAVGESLVLSALTEGEDAADLYSFKTSDKKIAKIVTNEDGTISVVGVKKGTAKITVTAKDGSGKTDTIKITVKK